MASRRKLVSIGVPLAVILIGALFVVFGGSRQSDEELIRQALADSIEASRDGRPGGVMDFLSDQFMINEQSPGTRMQIAKFIRDSKPDVEVLNPSPVVQGDTAEIVSPVRVQAQYLAFSMDHTIDNVRLHFERQTARRLIFFPTRKWRLTQVQVPDNAVPQQLFY